MPHFETVLVANRGEIARRIIRTLRRLGIRSVAVYSDADADAPHVREADVALRIGPAAAAHSYLDAAAILDAARASGAKAIHPGYGFLSENVEFARACTDAGIAFIGPGEQALAVMGDKIRAKAHVAARGVPVVAGFDAAAMSDEQIAEAAAATGFPLLIKPSAGGGGKGMQIVRSRADLPEALATARRVAAAAFGDDTLLLERLIESPRHIEVQVMADAHGTVIHLGERECTLQRRHQKVIEESPSPIVDARTRARLGAAACAAAQSVEYRGAGTVEFLVAADRPDEFFFIEMNTRLQVEHPVTELVTGLDLVELQLRVAAGGALGLSQSDIRLTGHSVEARVYAERPSRGFLPATGDVLLWRPAPGVRTDAAVETGSTVTPDYDPMIAKVIAHGADRAEALGRLDAALAGTVLLGVDTNIAFLRMLLAHPGVCSGDMDTGLIDRLPVVTDPPPSPRALSATAAAAADLDRTSSRRAREQPAWPPRALADTPSTRVSALWSAGSGWRAGADAVARRFLFATADGSILNCVVAAHDDAATVAVGSSRSRAQVIGRALGEGITLARAADGLIWVHADGVTSALEPLGRRAAMQRRLAARAVAAGAARPDLRASMPGTVVAVHVADGAHVQAGERLVTIEAMKMEHSVSAPHDGTVTVETTVGEQVRRDQVLARVDPRATDRPQESP